MKLFNPPARDDKDLDTKFLQRKFRISSVSNMRARDLECMKGCGRWEYFHDFWIWHERQGEGSPMNLKRYKKLENESV